MLEISTKVSDEDFEKVLNILSNNPVGLTLDVKWISSDFEKRFNESFLNFFIMKKNYRIFGKNNI